MSESLAASLLEPPAKPRQLTKRVATGYVALALLICSWVAQSEVAQYIQATLGFNKPYFVTWLNHSAMALLVPAYWRSGTRAKLETEFGMSVQRVLALMAVLSILYTFGDYAWYLALPFTSVAEATALFNSQSVFAYFFSVILLNEALRPLKVLAMAISIGGICVITAFASDGGGGGGGSGWHNGSLLVPPPSPPPPASGLELLGGSRLVGDAFAVGAASAYAAYEVLYKRGLGEAGSDDTRLVNVATGLVGCCSIVVSLPGFFALDAGVERFEMPPTLGICLWLLLNAALALVYNACLMLSVARLSPLTTSVGCMLTIPLASLVDVLWHATPFTWADAAGATLIIGGFGLLLFAENAPAAPRVTQPATAGGVQDENR